MTRGVSSRSGLTVESRDRSWDRPVQDQSRRASHADDGRRAPLPPPGVIGARCRTSSAPTGPTVARCQPRRWCRVVASFPADPSTCFLPPCRLSLSLSLLRCTRGSLRALAGRRIYVDDDYRSTSGERGREIALRVFAGVTKFPSAKLYDSFMAPVRR